MPSHPFPILVPCVSSTCSNSISSEWKATFGSGRTTLNEDKRVPLCGDFNARVGRSRKDENQWHGILGNYGSSQSNENGLLLLKTCTTHNLRICNTFFKRKVRGTWQHPRSKKWHQLDHILCRKKDCHNNIVCLVGTTAECWTDHQMVILKQKLEDKTPSHNKIKNKQQSTLHRSVVPNQKLASEKLIRNLGLREDVKIALDQHIEELIKKDTYMESSISDQFSQLSETVPYFCRVLLKPPKRKNAYWFEDNDTHLDRLLETRRAKFKKYLHQRTPENKKIHQQSQRTVREHLRTMENKFWEKQSSELEQYSMRGNSHAFYKCLKTIYGPNKSQSVQQIFQKKDGTLTKSPKESLARLQDTIQSCSTVTFSSTQLLTPTSKRLENRHSGNLISNQPKMNFTKPSKVQRIANQELMLFLSSC